MTNTYFQLLVVFFFKLFFFVQLNLSNRRCKSQ